MRMVALVCLLAATASPTKATGEQTRVVFCAERMGVCATLRPLGRAASGFWAKVSDAELLANRDPLPVLLYTNTTDLEEALAGLDVKGRKEAIAHRREYLTRHADAWVWDMLQTDMPELAAAVADVAGPELALVLDADVELGDDVVRMMGTRAADAVPLVRWDLAHVLVELPEGPLAYGYREEDALLAALYRPTGHSPKDGDAVASPFAEPRPAYFVPSMSDQDFRELAHSNGFPHRWHGGVAAILSPRDLERSPLKGQAVRMLYLGEGPYLADLMELSPAQLNLRLQARVKRIPANERPRMVADLAFSHAKRFRSLTPCLEREKVPWLPRWRQIAALADENLRSALRAAYPDAGRQRSTRLRELREDLALAAVLLRDGEDRARLERVRKMLASLPP